MLPGDLYLAHLWSVTIRGPSIRSCGILRARKRKNAQARASTAQVNSGLTEALRMSAHLRCSSSNGP